MEFEPGHLYHVFNRGNNSQKIFFTPANYLYFLNKIKTNILPHADILAWCLMPTHFHLMIHVKEPELVTIFKSPAQYSTAFNLTEQVTKKVTSSGHQLSNNIGNLLSSYTKAIQKQENRTGSLFQHRTKAPCLTRMNGISKAWFDSAYGAIMNVSIPEKEYPQVCFNYIHGNPVKDRLVKLPEEWEYSSARDYAGLRNGKLINKNRVKEFGLKYF